MSSIYWDHNDNFPQFSGCHALLPSGYMSILSKLAKGFDIKYDSVVRHVEIVGGEGSGGGSSLGSAVRLTDTRGNEWLASKVSDYLECLYNYTYCNGQLTTHTQCYVGYSDSATSGFEVKRVDIQSSTQ